MTLSPEKEKQADEFLKTMEKAYKDIGDAGFFGILTTILPLKVRWMDGERTEEIYEEIMGLA